MVGQGGQVRLEIVVRTLSEFKKMQREMAGTNAKVKLLATGVGNLGNRLGFVAFQMTFLAGVAGRALGQIGIVLKQTIEEAAGAQDQIVRAIAQSGIDITKTNEKTIKSVKFLNDAIRTLGGGRTIFNQKEVAEAAKELGRAFDLQGNDMQKARQLAFLLQGNLRLMTIEQIGAEKAAINLSKVMKTFSKDVSEVNDVVNTLVVVNQQSSITLDGLVRSLAFVGSFANEAGASLEEVAVILGVIQDRLGRTEGGPGQNFRVLLENLQRIAPETAAGLRAVGIVLRDDAGQFQNITKIINQFATAFKRSGKAGSIARQAILEIGTKSIRAKTALLNLIQGVDDLNRGLENIGEKELLAGRLEEIFSNTAEARIKKFTAALNSLKIDLINGLSPAIEVLAMDLRLLIQQSEVQAFFLDIGKLLGEEITPIFKLITKAVSLLTRILKENTLIMKAMIKIVIGLASVLGLLLIVGTVGALVAAMLAGLQKLILFLGITRVVMLGLVVVMIRFIAFMLLALLVVRAVSKIIVTLRDGFQEGEAAIIAFNVALAGLGIAGLLLVTRLSLLKIAIGSLGLAGLGSAISKLLGGGLLVGGATGFASFGAKSGGLFKGGFLAGLKGIGPKILLAFRGLGALGPIGIAIAAAIGIGLAVKNEIDKRVKESILFEKGFFADEAEAGMFELQAMISSTFLEIGFSLKAFGLFAIEVANTIARAWAALWTGIGKAMLALATGDWQGALLIAQIAFKNFTQNLGLDEAFDSFRKFVDTAFLVEATLETIINKLRSGDQTIEDTVAGIKELLEVTKTADQLRLGNVEALQKIIQSTESGKLLDAKTIEAIIRNVLSDSEFDLKIIIDVDPLKADLSTAKGAFAAAMKQAKIVQALSKIEQEALALKNQFKFMEGKIQDAAEPFTDFQQSLLDATKGITGTTVIELSGKILELQDQVVNGTLSFEQLRDNLDELANKFVVDLDIEGIFETTLKAIRDNALQEEIDKLVIELNNTNISFEEFTLQTNKLKEQMDVDLDLEKVDDIIDKLIEDIEEIDIEGLGDALGDTTDVIEEVAVKLGTALGDTVENIENMGRESEEAAEAIKEQARIAQETFDKLFGNVQAELFETGGSEVDEEGNRISPSPFVSKEAQEKAEALVASLLAELEESGGNLTQSSADLLLASQAYAETLTNITGELGKSKDFSVILNENLDLLGKQIVDLTTLTGTVGTSTTTFITSQDELSTEFIKVQDASVNQITAITKEISELAINTLKLGINSDLLSEDSLRIIEEIIELANNQNHLAIFSVAVSQATVGFTKLAIESIEAARRLASLRVSKSGKFSISGRNTKTLFDEIPGLEALVKAQLINLREELSDINAINLDQLKQGLQTNSKQPVDADSVIQLRHGGIVSGDTIARLGEGGPEAVIPLDQLESLGGVTNNITVNVEGNIDEDTAEEMGETILEIINDGIKSKRVLRR